MDPAIKVAKDVARRFIPRPERKGMEEAEYARLRDEAEFKTDAAAKMIVTTIEDDRKRIRAETIHVCAELAEMEFSQDPAWDEPVYSAMGAGRWIGTAIRSTELSNWSAEQHRHTNNPPALVRRRREREQRAEKERKKHERRNLEGRGHRTGSKRKAGSTAGA